jgi:hypothetical protein
MSSRCPLERRAAAGLPDADVDRVRDLGNAGREATCGPGEPDTSLPRDGKRDADRVARRGAGRDRTKNDVDEARRDESTGNAGASQGAANERSRRAAPLLIDGAAARLRDNDARPTAVRWWIGRSSKAPSCA